MGAWAGAARTPSLPHSSELFPRPLDPAKLDAGVGWAVQPPGSQLRAESAPCRVFLSEQFLGAQQRLLGPPVPAMASLLA